VTTSKRHHYVPQRYLSGFCDVPLQIHVYDRVRNEYRQQPVINTAVKKHYYRVKLKSGEFSDNIETLLSEFEGPTWPVIDKISDGKDISDIDKQKLAMYVALQKLRVPEYELATNELREKMVKMINKLEFSSVAYAQEQIDKYKHEIPDNNEIKAEYLYNFIHNEEYNVEVPREHTIDEMLKRCTDFAQYFLQMNWTFAVCSRETQFITSDNPFTLIAPDKQSPYRGCGILTPGAMKVMPLTKSVALCMGDKGEAMFYKKISRDWVKQFNCHHAVTSSQYLFSGNLALLKSIVKRTGLFNLPHDRERVSMTGEVKNHT
jgi:transcription-repair coupling factor (superfamily II helicase)